MRLRKITALFLVMIFMASAFAGCSQKAETQENPIAIARRIMESFAFSPVEEDDTGVDTASGFTLTCDAGLEAEDLRAMVSISPPAAFTLEKQGDGEFRLDFERELQKNTVYQVSVKSEPFDLGRTFAFQTKRDFALVSSRPSDGEQHVSLDQAIEMNFSVVDVDIEEYFSITPAVKGRFETYNYTVVFIPDKPWELSTDYEVVIGGDLPCATGQTLGEDKRISFQTTDYDSKSSGYVSKPSFSHKERFSETYLPGDPVIVEFYAYEVNDSFSVELYRYPDLASYQGALEELAEFGKKRPYGEEGLILSTGGLDYITGFTTESASKDNPYSYSNHILLPELEQGYYLADIGMTGSKNGEEAHLQKLIQISDVAVYAQSMNGQSLLWLHDGNTGAPLADAQVKLYQDFSSPPVTLTADEEGIAVSDRLEDEHYFFSVETGGRLRYIDRLALPGQRPPKGEEMYFSMVYKDREIYMPTDTVNVWGVLRQRSSSYPLPEYVQLKLYEGWGWYDSSGEGKASDPPLALKNATVREDGTYVADIRHESLRSDNYYIVVCTPDDVVIQSSGLVISDYVKPDYVVQADFDKPFYTLDESMGMDVSVTFFDGTPAHDMRLHIGGDMYGGDMYGGDMQVARNGTTGQDGRLRADMGRTQDNGKSWHPFYRTFRIISADTQNSQALFYPRAAVIPRDVMMEANYTAGKNYGSIEITTNRIDTSRITDAAQIFENNYANIRGEAVDLPVRVQITQREWVEDGIERSYYDFITGRTAYIYQYREVIRLVRDENLRTQNGKLILTDLPVAKGRVSYDLEVSTRDGAGRAVASNSYLYASWGSSNADYNLYFDSGRDWDDPGYKLDEEVTLSVASDGREFDMRGRTLYTLMQEDIIKQGISDDAVISIPFDKNMIPNATYAGAFFDGRHIYPVRSGYYDANLRYNSEDEALNVEVTADKERYRPGERATLRLKVTDSSGKPAASSMAVGVVDEAVFALREQDIQPLQMLYRSVYSSGNLRTYVSYVQHNSLQGGGKGGGGGGELSDVRKDFADTALFWAASTGEDGEAAVSFIVPDNLTSWRVTALAVDGNLRAGKSIDNVVGTLPYFVKPALNRRYLAGEDVVLSAKVYGDMAVGASTVTATLEGGASMTEEIELEDYAYFNLGKLPAGAYAVTVGAEGYSGLSDSIRQEFSVVESLMELSMSRELELGDVSGLGTLSYPVTLAVYDRENAAFMECLSRMLTADPTRYDQKVAMAAAQDLLRSRSVDGELPAFAEASVDIGSTLDDPSMTVAVARACVAAPDYLPKGEAAQFLYARLRDRESAEDWSAAAYMGLAALGEPVLLDVRLRLLAPDLDLTHRLYYMAALAALGDVDTATAQYDEHVAPLLGKTEGHVWLEQGGEANDVIYLRTSVAYYTALLTGKTSEALDMLRYLADMGSDRYTCALESAAYATRYQPDAEGESRFTYSVMGETRTVALKPGEVKYLRLSRQGLESAGIRAISGELAARAFYTAGPEAFEAVGERYVTVSKRYSTGSADVGDLVDFTLDIRFGDDAPEGWYKLVDFLPTNTRFFSGGIIEPYSGIWWNSRVFREQNQKLSLWIYFRPYGAYPTERDYSFTYSVRVIYAGDYIAESAYLLHENGLVAVRTPRQSFDID